MGRFIEATIIKDSDGVAIRDDIDNVKDFSAAEKCPAMSVDVHDDDILSFTFFLNGECIDSYNSCPGFFDDSDTTPAGGDASALASAFGRLEHEARIEDILRFDSINGDDEDRYCFATDRLIDLIEALGGDPSKLPD